MASTMDPPSAIGRLPTYFLGIGGPNFIENKNHPAFTKLNETGREITSKVKPKAVVVFSAHWQHGPNTIAVNVAENTNVIYDFHGFPPHFYEYDYPSRGSPEIAEKVISNCQGLGLKSTGSNGDSTMAYGWDFSRTNPLNVPLIQVSLLGDEDPAKHYRIGQALESLRDEGVLLIGAGMAVHNLEDFRASRGLNKDQPYASSFEQSLNDALAAAPEDRQSQMTALMKQPDARRAHPTFEHVLPIFVTAGAAGSDVGERMWSMGEGSLNWAQYRFGSV